MICTLHQIIIIIVINSQRFSWFLKQDGSLTKHYLFIILLQTFELYLCTECYCFLHENIQTRAVSNCRVIYLG
jgi:hypothetical protein